MKTPLIVSPEEWRAARERLLAKEKELTRARDALAAERRRMPWLAVGKEYRLEGLIVFGLLILAAGAAGMTASVGGFGQAFSRRSLFDNRVSAYIGLHGWVWYAAAGLCLVIILVALLWIAALIASTDRVDDIPIPVASHEGTTILLPAALTDALTREIGAYHGVEAVRGRIIGDADDPEIVLAVAASQTVGLHALHQRIETEALAHAREALGKADLTVRLDLAISRTP